VNEQQRVETIEDFVNNEALPRSDARQ